MPERRQHRELIGANRLATLVAEIQKEHNARLAAQTVFHDKKKEAIEHAIKCGLLLLEVQAGVQLNGSKWGEWVEKHLPFGIRQAQRYTDRARNPEKLRLKASPHVAFNAERELNELPPKAISRKPTVEKLEEALQRLDRQKQAFLQRYDARRKKIQSKIEELKEKEEGT